MEKNPSPGTAVEPLLSEPSADLGWLQADSLFDPFSDFFLSYENPILASVDVSSGTHVPVTCSLLGFL